MFSSGASVLGLSRRQMAQCARQASTVGFIGLGNMGSGMAANLIQKGNSGALPSSYFVCCLRCAKLKNWTCTLDAKL